MVLLDLNLPFYDGYDILEKIRSSENIKHIPVSEDIAIALKSSQNSERLKALLNDI